MSSWRRRQMMQMMVGGSPTPPITYTGFYIEDVSGATNSVSIKKQSSNAPTLTIEKSTNGVVWETVGTTSNIAISAAIPANGKLFLRCSTNQWALGTGSVSNVITATSAHKIGGNILSLLYGSNFDGTQSTFPTSDKYIFLSLFTNDTTLIDASDLVLPDTTLQYCYCYMFKGCTNLTTAPELLATTTTMYCYFQMFYNCANLTYIKCLATNIAAASAFGWVFGVAANGTFVKHPSMTTWPTGDSGIPTGWTVQDAVI